MISIGTLDSLLLLRRQRAGESDALHSPGLERSLRGDRLGIDPKPALHLASAHLKRSRTGLREESLGSLLQAAGSLAAFAAGPHAMWPSIMKPMPPRDLALDPPASFVAVSREERPEARRGYSLSPRRSRASPGA